jgi:hypothetical protein
LSLDIDRIDVLRDEVKDWSVANFGDSKDAIWPFSGMVEEIGELSHARLKGHQGIRGTKQEHEEAEKDAIADAAIFCLNLLGKLVKKGVKMTDALGDKAYLPEPPIDPEFVCEPAAHAAYLALVTINGGVATVLYETMEEVGDTPNAVHTVCMLCTHFLSALNCYSVARGWNFMELLEATWSTVKRRNWRADPDRGGLPAPHFDGAHASTYVPVTSLVAGDPIPDNDLGEAV